MSLFASNRERRLWLALLAVMAALYASLGPARTLADALRARDLLEVTFAVGVGLGLGALAAAWWRQRPGWREIGVALGVVLAYLLLFVRMESPEERTHLVEYGVVAALLHQALLERARQGRAVPMPAVLAVVGTALLGLLDEGLQLALPRRVFDVRDVFFNALAGFMVVAARLAIGPQRGPGWRLWFLWLMAASVGWGQGVYWGWFSGDEPIFLEAVPPVPLAGALGVAVGGLLSGSLQALALRRHLARPWRWVLASLGAVAVTVAGVVGVGGEVGWVAGVGVFGTVAGGLQWAVLRGQVPRAGWWVLASTAGWALALPAGDAVGPLGLGAAYGALTATVMVGLLRRRPASDAPSGGAAVPGGPLRRAGR